MPGLASLLSRRTMNPRAAGAAAMRRNRPRPIPIPRGLNPDGTPYVSPLPLAPPPRPVGPPGGKNGGYVKGYQGGGRTRNIMNPRAIGAAGQARNLPRSRYVPGQARQYQRGGTGVISPGGWQLGGEVGAAPEEVAMASEIFARATPEQQAQITGGGGGPGMMEEEAAIGEALAMAMGGGGGPPMGGPPMNGAPPMGGLI